MRILGAFVLLFQNVSQIHLITEGGKHKQLRLNHGFLLKTKLIMLILF